MTPVELHAHVVAQWQAKLDTARAATPRPWEHVDHASPYGQPMTREGLPSTFMGCGSVITMADAVLGGDICAPNGDLYPRGGYSPSEDMDHIAAFDPTFAIAVCEAALRRLERHAPQRPRMVACRWCTDDDTDVPWPCPEVLDDAAPYAGLSDFPEELRRGR